MAEPQHMGESLGDFVDSRHSGSPQYDLMSKIAEQASSVTARAVLGAGDVVMLRHQATVRS